MDVVDGQIIDTLCRLDPNFFDGLPEIPNNIAGLSIETFYQAIVMLVWSCKPNTRKEIPSRLLPQNMSTKFRCVTTVVDASIGVRDPIDYHMLLYGRSKELRNILIGLMEKLPKDSSVITSAEGMFYEIIFILHQYPLRDLIRSSFHSEGDKEGCLTRYSSAQKKVWAASARVDFVGFCGNVMAALQCEDWRYRRSAFICSLLENNAINNSRTQNYQPVRDEISEILHLRRSVTNKGMKPQLKPKPVLTPELQEKAKTKNEQEINEVSKVNAEKSEVLNKLLNEVVALTASVNRKKISMTKMQNDEAERLLLLRNKKLQEAEIDERLEKLLGNPDAISKLENYIDGSNERMQRLQNLWLTTKAEKDEEVKTARLIASSSDFTLPYYNRETSAKDTKLIEDEIADKKKILEKLRKQIELREEKQINRSIYTKHIFDIVGNIRKQQNEINKIAVENLSLQKEIRSSAGKLERSFTVVEGKLYKDVEKDASMQKAYRLLMKIHGEFSCVITGIDSAGQLEREIEELSDQIAMQHQKNTDERLECIVNDWMEIKKENVALKELLKECDS
uniref:Coiled-coil domain-containing protein 22 homolog n=1 Tax=Elaeophora elaphi TaxID=1147741 RepID=A0A0R3S229_9BILA